MATKNATKQPSPSDTVDRLNPKHEAFCRYYTQNDQTFGNATLSYAYAFDYKLDELPDDDEVRDESGVVIEASSYDKAYKVCSVMGHRLLRNASIQQRNVVLLNELLTDQVVDSELAKVIKQDGDLTPKVAGIKEYNKVRGRIIDKTKIITEKFSMDDIRALLAPLPPERQDEIYAILTTAIADAELLGSSAQGKGRDTQ